MAGILHYAGSHAATLASLLSAVAAVVSAARAHAAATNTTTIKNALNVDITSGAQSGNIVNNYNFTLPS
jgi:hypothetical protein